MDLVSHLRAFVAVAEEEHVTRGASRLGAAQPVVSRQIKALEQRLGVALFVRAGRQVVLTEAARQLVPVARDLVERADRILELGQQLRGTAGSGLRLAVPYAADLHALAEAIRLAAEAGVALTLVEADDDERRARLADGRADLALVRVSAQRADFVVPLGFGTAPGTGDDEGSAPRPLHLDALRGRAGRRPARVVLVQPEDTLPLLLDDLTRAAGHAGLTADQVQAVPGGALTAARVLAGEDVLLCSRQEAQRFRLAWRPSADRLERCFGLEATASARTQAPAGLDRVLRRALGGRPPAGDDAGTQPRAGAPAGLFG